MEKQAELQRFFREVTSNETIMDHLKGCSNAEEFCKRVVEHGRSSGYNFTESDVRASLPQQKNEELSTSELDRSVGGDWLNDFTISMGKILASYKC